MKKSNVTKIFDGKGQGLPLMDSVEPQLIAYLLFLPDTEEFLFSQNFEDGFSLHVYTKEPFFAYCFETEQQAHRVSLFIEREIIVVPLFDYGDVLGVAFPDDTES